jgi:hypothetical protein
MPGLGRLFIEDDQWSLIRLETEDWIMGHHKRGRPKNRRAGCLLCKPWKVNGAGGSNRGELKEKFSDFKRRYFAKYE